MHRVICVECKGLIGYSESVIPADMFYYCPTCYLEARDL